MRACQKSITFATLSREGVVRTAVSFVIEFIKPINSTKGLASSHLLLIRASFYRIVAFFEKLTGA